MNPTLFYVLTAGFVFLILLCLIRVIRGPRLADRIVAGNMIGTMVLVLICMLSVFLKEDYLADVAIVYAMLSFVAVVLLTKVYMGVYRENKETEETKDDGMD